MSSLTDAVSSLKTAIASLQSAATAVAQAGQAVLAAATPAPSPPPPPVNPPPDPPAPSPDGTSITPPVSGSVAGQIVTPDGTVWTFGTMSLPGGTEILQNGKNDGSAAANQLILLGGILFALNSLGVWYQWTPANGWQQAASPLAPPPAPPAPPASGVPAVAFSAGFTSKAYEFVPSAAPMAGLDIAFDHSAGHAWYPMIWWQPNQYNESAANFTYDPSDGALVIAPTSGQGSCGLQSFQDVSSGGTGTIGDQGFVNECYIEFDVLTQNGSNVWSMAQSHVQGGAVVSGQPSTYNTEFDFCECAYNGPGGSNTKQIPSTLHLNTSSNGGVKDQQNYGAAGGWAPCPNGQDFTGQRHVLGILRTATEFKVFVDGVQVNSFSGANFYASAPEPVALFFGYADNYMISAPNSPKRELRVYRISIWTA